MDNDLYLSADRFPLVRDVGWSHTENAYTHPDRVLCYDVFLFVSQGSMHVIEEGTAYVVKENHHLFLKRGLHHWGMPVTEPGTRWYWIHFNLPDDPSEQYREHSPIPELEYYGQEHYNYCIRLPKYGTSNLHPHFTARLEALVADYRTPGSHSMTHVSLRTCQLFLELQQATGESYRTGKTDTIAGRVISYLMHHTEENFDSGQLAEHMNLNYSYLSAAFKVHTGQTIVDAHTRLRMNKAMEWMRNSTLNISEISAQLGYQNPFYFSKVFKKVTGESPSSYMRHLYKP